MTIKSIFAAALMAGLSGGAIAAPVALTDAQMDTVVAGAILTNYTTSTTPINGGWYTVTTYYNTWDCPGNSINKNCTLLSSVITSTTQVQKNRI